MNTENWTFRLGDRVTKTKGSSWTGLVVGFYSTTLTPEGYAVESENERGSVQIYPGKFLKEAGDAMSCHTDTRSMQPEETHPIDAWNTRADAAPTPKADEVEAVARAIAPSRWEVMDHYLAQTKKKYAGENAAYDPDNFKDRESMATAQAAIAALDAARGDRVTRVVEWLRTGAMFAASDQEIADAIERGEPFNG